MLPPCEKWHFRHTLLSTFFDRIPPLPFFPSENCKVPSAHLTPCEKFYPPVRNGTSAIRFSLLFSTEFLPSLFFPLKTVKYLQPTLPPVRNVTPCEKWHFRHTLLSTFFDRIPPLPFFPSENCKVPSAHLTPCEKCYPL